METCAATSRAFVAKPHEIRIQETDVALRRKEWSYSLRALQRRAVMAKRQRRELTNPIVFFDITIGSQHIGRILFELYKDAVPKVSPPIHDAVYGGQSSNVCMLFLILWRVDFLNLKLNSPLWLLTRLGLELGSGILSRAFILDFDLELILHLPVEVGSPTLIWDPKLMFEI